MVSYFWPPAATGVRRVLSLARWLPEFGWFPAVLACRRTRGEGQDERPLQDPAIGAVPVARTESWDPYRLLARREGPIQDGTSAGASSPIRASSLQARAMGLLRRHVFVPDDRIGWKRFAFAEGQRLLRSGRFRAIYSTNYPQTAHEVGRSLARSSGLPWLADFRDGWTQNPVFSRFGNPLVAATQHLLEQRTAEAATAIVTVSPPITRHLQSLRPPGLLPAETIYNGFEPDLLAPAGVAREPLHPGKMTLLYTGTFFGPRRPDGLLRGLAEALRREPELRSAVVLRLRTVLDQPARDLLRELDLSEAVEVLPPVPFHDIVAEQRRADGCVLVLESGPGAEIMVSQKVFEYLAARRPIFALVPRGAAREVLEETGGAAIVDAEAEPDETGEALREFLGRVRGGESVASEERLARYDRRRQAKRMAEILDNLPGAE
ncbi:MAG: hypothetical protein RLY93_07975 [Sumerlaeia bacterium]